MDKKSYDVLVIGAGPVGSYLAQRLARDGYKVAVFEEHERIGEPMQCTGIIGVECFQRFQLPTDTVLREANSARLFSPSGKVIRLHSSRPQAYILDRTAFDCQLADAAKSQGAEYFTSSRATDITVLNDRVSISTDKGETFDGRVAVIASGFYSKLPQALGLGRVKDFITGAQADVEIKAGSGLDEIEIYFDQSVAPDFFAWLVPTTPQRALAGLFARRVPRKHLREFLATLSEKGRIVSSEVKIMHGGIPLKPLRKTYCDRVVVVGDAAGQVKPTTGGGVFYGLLCADIAADILHKALSSNNLSARSLSRYQTEWHKAIGRELRNGYIARHAYEKLSNRGIERLFNFALKKGIPDAINQSPNISFDWHGKAMTELIKISLPKLLK
jgi:digeranylgeranylglycerophospholipid reductase